MRPASLYIRALGALLPPGRVTVAQAVSSGQCDAAGLLGNDVISVAVGDGATGVGMATEAGRLALSRAGVPPDTVDLLIHATMLPEGPDGWSPAGYVLRELGCGQIACHEVRQGCNGLLAALELAAGWLALTAGEPTALLTAALKAGTAVLDRWRSPGFGLALGDAGCAVLVGRGHGIARVESVCSRTVGELEGLHRGTGAPSEDDACSHPRIDIPARARQFTAASGHGPLDIHRMLAGIHVSVASRALAEAEVEPADLACVIYTNAGRVITDAHLLQPLGLPATLAAACDLGRTIGHLGACDQFVSLDHLCQTGRLVSGDRVLLAGGTQGYNAASAVLTITG